MDDAASYRALYTARAKQEAKFQRHQGRLRFVRQLVEYRKPTRLGIRANVAEQERSRQAAEKLLGDVKRLNAELTTAQMALDATNKDLREKTSLSEKGRRCPVGCRGRAEKI